jgi:hypothetical protein
MDGTIRIIYHNLLNAVRDVDYAVGEVIEADLPPIFIPV